MFHLFSALAALVIAADGEPSSTSEVVGIADARMAKALTHSILDNFVGTISYELETVRPNDSSATKNDRPNRTTQQWSTALDGNGNIRAKVTWPGAPKVGTWQVGRTPTETWLLRGNELHVYKTDFIMDDDPEANSLHVANALLNQTEFELERLLGPPVPSGPKEVLMIDRSETAPGAVVDVNGEVRSISFDRVDDDMLLRNVVSSSERSYEAFTFRWTYSGHQQIRGHWVPTAVYFEQITQIHPSNSLERRYSRVQVSPTVDRRSADVRRAAQLPQPNEPEIGSVAIVKTFSNDGVTLTTFHGGTEIQSTE